jgi:hypothetical protein
VDHVQLLRVVVTSPGDVQAEHNSLPAVIEKLNQSVAWDRNLRLELARWETVPSRDFTRRTAGADRSHLSDRGLRRPHRHPLETLRHSGAECQVRHGT